MILSAKGTYAYVPKFNENRSLPEREQVTVEIIRPRAEERGQLYSFDPEREVGLTDFENPGGSASITFKTRYRTGRILRNHVGVIKNLSVEENGKIHAITTGAELAECTAFGVANFIQELTAEVLSDQLSAEEKKSTPPPSNSSTKDGPENGGTMSTMTNGNSSALVSSNGENSQTT
ncbi:MAG: hypothetical protein FWG29_01735 [Treponema sp.]|nr:hypothetical protein [Treponema sp.]